MELKLSDAELDWSTQEEKNAGRLPLPELMRVVVLLPVVGGASAEAQELSLPCTLRVTTSETGEEQEGSETVGERSVVFKVLEGEHLVISHAMKLQDCVPLLSEGTISWTRDVVVNNVGWRVVCWVD
jgi:hypothetical protein